MSAETWCWTGWQLGLGTEAQHFALSAAWIVFASVLIQVGILRAVFASRWSGVALLPLTAVKVFTVDPPLTATTYVLVPTGHCLPLLFIVVLLAELVYAHYREGNEKASMMAICRGRSCSGSAARRHGCTSVGWRTRDGGCSNSDCRWSG